MRADKYSGGFHMGREVDWSRADLRPGQSVGPNGDCGWLVLAPAPGTVSTETEEKSGGNGNLVRIDHGGGWETWLAHVARFAVADGAIGRAALLGYVGTTGNSTRCHIHQELRYNGAKVDVVVHGRAVLDNQLIVSTPAFSPDGSRIVFARKQEGWDIYIVKIDGSTLRRVANSPAIEWRPDWGR